QSGDIRDQPDRRAVAGAGLPTVAVPCGFALACSAAWGWPGPGGDADAGSLARLSRSGYGERLKRGHDVVGEHPQLVLPIGGGHAFRPVEDDVLEARVLRFEVLQQADDALGRT